MIWPAIERTRYVTAIRSGRQTRGSRAGAIIGRSTSSLARWAPLLLGALLAACNNGGGGGSGGGGTGY
jgi:hypothetical protein